MCATKLNPKYKGILCLLFASFSFACMNLMIRLAGDIPTFQKSFFRNLIAMMIAAVMLAREGAGFRPASWKNWPFFLGRCCCGTIGILCNFYAVDHLLMSDASMLSKMSPFFAVLASAVLLKEKLKPIHVITLTGAFAGALCIIKPTLSNMALGASLIGFLGGVGAGLAYTFVRMLGQRGERGAFIVFFFSAFSCLAMVPFVIFAGKPMTMQQTLILIGAGIAASGGQFGITMAYSCAPAREISVYDYSQVIFSAIIGFIAFGDVPDALSFLGYFVICSMAVLNFWYNNHHKPKAT